MDSSNESVESTGVVIVGAGIAGLGAAQKLEQSNFKDYILLEAQSQVGGRIYSTPWKAGWLEKGAQFLHGTNSELGELIIKKGLLSDMQGSEGQGLYVREDGKYVDKKLVADIEKSIGKLLEKCTLYSDMEASSIHASASIGSILKKKLAKKLKTTKPEESKTVKELFDWHYRFIAIDNACNSLDDLSVERWGDYKAVGGDEYNLFKSHYGSITEAIAKNLTQKNIRLNCPVDKIEWDSSMMARDAKSIVITLNNGKKIKADCAIVTCSLGYLKEHHGKLFSPTLPIYYSNVIESLGFGVINKVFLDFDEPWWEPKSKGFQFLWNVDAEKNNRSHYVAPWTRDFTGFDVVPTQRGVLVGWIGREGAEIMETLNEQQVMDDCTQLLRYFLKGYEIPEPKKCLRTTWKSNEFVRGAYCYISKKSDETGSSPGVLSEPICRKVMFDNGAEKCLPILMLAGEATHRCHYSTTHGAYKSGMIQAERFLRATTDLQ